MDLREQLQQHLGSSYLLGRELGGGGMSRVFVADEVRLGRQVVVKVLSPDLAQGINAERFEREIKTAASLQQANIVPLHAAGEVAGLPYFTMPFVEGESLRHRLTQGPLSINEVVVILRDVTRALAYAHARGVVHRDIKPDNVLLSGGAAVVTDFGIAKAISASRTDAPGGTLTQLGTSIGTPAYMAPEQVAGDPNLDHRVDLYALGCMAYELLTGQQPFANRTPQKMLAAHLSETATSMQQLRPDAPPGLVVLVNQLMAKDPNDRPQTANDVLRALDAAITSSAPTVAFTGPGMLRKSLLYYAIAVVVVLLCTRAAIIAIGLPDWVFPGAIVLMALGLPALLITAYVQRVARHTATATPTLTPGGSMAPKMPSGTIATVAMKVSPHVTWRRTWRGGVVAIGSFVFLVTVFMVTRAFGIGPWGSLLASGKLAATDRVVLADIDVPPADSALGPIVDEAIRAALSQSRSVNLVPQTDIAEAMQEMKRPKDGALNDPTLVHDVAVRTDAKAVLGGRLARLGNGYAVSLELSSAQGGTVLASYQATAASSQDLLSTIDGLARKLRGKVGESLKQVQRTIPLERATTTSLPALRKYSDAVIANDIDFDYPRAVQSARDAVALDSTFALAWRKLAVALFNSFAPMSAQDSAIEHAVRYADRLPDRERYLLLGYDYENGVSAADRGKSLDAYRSAYQVDSSNTTATNQLGLLYHQRHQQDSAMRYWRRQVQIETNPGTVGRVVIQLAEGGHGAEAAALLDSVVKADPAAAASNLMMYDARVGTLIALGKRDSVMAIAAQMIRSPDATLHLNGLFLESMNAPVLGKLQRMIEVDSELAAVAPGSNPALDVPLARAQADVVLRDKAADGVKLVDDVVAGHAWTGTAPSDRPYFGVIELYARAGRPDRARAMLTQFQNDDPAAKAPDTKSDVALAEGRIAIAEGKFDDAIRQIRAAELREDGLPVECRACVEFELARAFDLDHQNDSAVVHLERYLSFPPAERSLGFVTADYLYLAGVEKRLGELYEEKHDRTRALQHYGAFVDLWKGADPDLQPVVASVRQRMALLTAQEGH
jgi:tetratricopeptide (TPR) repeat protein